MNRLHSLGLVIGLGVAGAGIGSCQDTAKKERRYFKYGVDNTTLPDTFSSTSIVGRLLRTNSRERLIPYIREVYAQCLGASYDLDCWQLDDRSYLNHETQDPKTGEWYTTNLFGTAVDKAAGKTGDEALAVIGLGMAGASLALGRKKDRI